MTKTTVSCLSSNGIAAVPQSLLGFDSCVLLAFDYDGLKQMASLLSFKVDSYQALAPVRHIQKITANICVISTKLCIAKPSIYLVKNDHCKKFKHSGGHCMSLKNNSGGQCFKINGWRLLLLTSQM